MNESKEMLRQRFYAQTNIEIGEHPGAWEQYAKWFEKLVIKELNAELVKDNDALQDKMQEAMDALDDGLTGAYKTRRKRDKRIRNKRT